MLVCYFNSVSSFLLRKMELHSVWRYLNTDSLENKVVYDLHSELQRETRSCEGMEEGEEEGRGEGEGEVPHAAGCLTFDARFESGNLMRAVKVSCVCVLCVCVSAWCIRTYMDFYLTNTQVQGNEYDLLLNSDINSDHYHRWFCFKVCVVPDYFTNRDSLDSCTICMLRKQTMCVCDNLNVFSDSFKRESSLPLSPFTKNVH